MGTKSAWRQKVDSLSDRAVEVLGPTGASWAHLVAGRVEAALRDWGLDVVAPLAGGRGGLVLRVRRGAEQFVLKAPMYEPAAHIAAQEHLDQVGVGPHIIFTDTERGLLLMELVEGDPVDRPTPLTIAVCAAQAARLTHTVPRSSFPSIGPWLRSRLVHQPADRSPTAVEPSASERMDALSALDDLEEASAASCFIHADLNVGNILWSEAEGIRLIDARGVVGDPAYDVALLAVKTQQPGAPLSEVISYANELAAATEFPEPSRCAQWAMIARAAQV